MASKPSTPAEWDSNGTNTSPTTAGHKADGWANNEVPTAGEFNHWQKQVSDWTKWLYDGDMTLRDISVRDLTITGQRKGTAIATASLTGAITTQNWDVVGGGANLTNIYAVEVTPGSSAKLGGLAGGVNGLEILITNVSGSVPFQLVQEDSGSTASNRFRFATSSLTVQPYETLWLRYVGSLSRWVVLDSRAVSYAARLRAVPMGIQTIGTSVAYSVTDGLYTSSGAWTLWTVDHGAWGVREGERITGVTVRGSVVSAGTYATIDLYRLNAGTGSYTSVETWTITTALSGFFVDGHTLASPQLVTSSSRYMLKISGAYASDKLSGIFVTCEGFPL